MQVTSVAGFQPYQSPTAAPVQNVKAAEHANAARSGENAGARANDLAWIQAVRMGDDEALAEAPQQDSDTGLDGELPLDQQLTAQLMRADAEGGQGDNTSQDAYADSYSADSGERESVAATKVENPPAGNDSAIALYNSLAGTGMTPQPGETLSAVA
ncbi:hypothetical protein [Aidingimonas halophila]|uniref:Uncharacterized protein n=1 Tax=Aidingimonas halophila TaxID=574349 RepID=A0A1H3D7L2_9GAMM|nr:hypothetical protein [Aidingimonas halophila]GHC30390.1 hypothetical protein GCM10008094_23370 [Aidingimonas halophila]SDX62391.1 hypothetical protein SAMN05443545_106212 [Aidingimonas halophila]